MRIVNFGCCDSARADDINIDGSPTVLFARLPIPARMFGSRQNFVRVVRTAGVRYATARSLRLPKASIDGFYASHVLEHLDREDCRALLSRVLTWLKPEGVLRVVLPDLRLAAENYTKGNLEADEFMAWTHLADRVGRFSLNKHLWMYDITSFCRLLKEIGYCNVRSLAFGESALDRLSALDLEERRHESFYVEACSRHYRARYDALRMPIKRSMKGGPSS